MRTIESFPSLFISHGAPTLATVPGEARDFLGRLGERMGAPEAILCISAHWETQEPTVSMATQPKTIHDFSGFPAELYDIRYPAPGAMAVAQKVTEALQANGISCQTDERGFDHGCWIPLTLMYPDAMIPVVQLSIQSHLDPRQHFALGQALRPLRHQGTLIMGSGGFVHNLNEIERNGGNGQPPTGWAEEFSEWMTERLEAGNVADLFDYRQLAPHAVRAHPRDDHLMPLFVALGAAGEPVQVRHLHQSWTYGTLSMAAFAMYS